MKCYKMIYGICIVLIFSSCANVDKLVDEGDYDRVIQIATKRLSGKKQKKEKYIQAAEKAFAKVTKRDMDRIAQLRARNGLIDWKKIFTISGDMLDRQRKIQPLLPLIGKEGYHAGFIFVKAEIIQQEARQEVTSRLYDMGQQALVLGRENNKAAARDAYGFFHEIQKFTPRYKNSLSLRREAQELGTTHVLLNIENNTARLLPLGLERELIDFHPRNSRWKKFYSDARHAPQIDLIGTLSFRLLEVSPEQVQETVHHFHKQVTESQFARDANGIPLRDSLGNKIEVFVLRDVRGEVIEINQVKEAVVNLEVELMDKSSRRILDRETFHGVSNFNNEACRIAGDRRAIEGRWLNLGAPQPFPGDDEMILLATEKVKQNISRWLDNINDLSI